MAPEQTVYCPLCGKKVSMDAGKCPVCGTKLDKIIARRELDKIIEKRIMRKLESTLPRDGSLQGRIFKTVLPEVKLKCPACALDLSGGESKCPRCGIPFGGPEEMLECPECGMTVAVGAKSCPKCGVQFAEVPEPLLPPPPEELVPSPPTPSRPFKAEEVVTPVAPERPASDRGLVNGMGTAAPRGMVNGTGITNGTGLVNGTGMVNGTKAGRPGVQGRSGMTVKRWQFLAVLIAVVIVIPTFIYISYARETGPFVIDGEFGDWDDVQTYGMRDSSTSSSLNFEEWAVGSSGTELYFYVQTQTDMMASPDVDSFFLFVDADGLTSTGYALGDISADYMLEVNGWNESVQSSTAYVFAGTDQYDWNKWHDIGSLAFDTSGTQLEAMANLPERMTEDSRYLLVSQDELERKAISFSAPGSGGLLIVEQSLAPAVPASGVIPSSISTQLLHLKFYSQGSGGSISQVTTTLQGATWSSTISPFSLTVGVAHEFDVSVDTSSTASGQAVSAAVEAVNVVGSFAEVTVIGEGACAYVGSAPATIQIDGAFGDWYGLPVSDVDLPPVVNPNIDIDQVAAVNNTQSSSFYVSVSGEMCSGSFVPAIKGKPTTGGGGGGILTKKTGLDILRIYIDSDMLSATGKQVTVSSKLIGADYLLEILGLNNKVVSSAEYVFTSGDWDTTTALVEAANDAQRLEVSVGAMSIGGHSSIEFIIETTDWSGRTDLATFDPVTARTLGGGVFTGSAIDRWIVDGPSVSTGATSMSYQRKVFFDGANYWSFYFDGSDTVYRYSADYGVTWSASNRAFKTNGVNETSVWFDSSNNVVYAVGDTSTASTDVYVQRGVVSPSLHTITWGTGQDPKITVSTEILGGKNTYICKDTNGYLWVLASNKTGTTTYDLSPFRSLTIDSIIGWSWIGSNMLNPDSSQMTAKGSIVPAGSGSDVWAVYTYDGNVAARKYTGTWTDPESPIYTLGVQDDPTNTDTAPPSVVVDSKGVVHVVYGNGHKKVPAGSLPHIYYAYNTSGSTAFTTYAISSIVNTAGFQYPTISIDTSTRNLFAFYVNMTADNGIVCRKYNGATWTTLDLGAQPTYVKQHLTSIYSVPSESLICWMWTQNNTGAIREVVFDKIPEFSDALVPVLFMMAVVVALSRRASRKKDA